MKLACDQILQSQKLKQVLGIVLSIGKFMNSGTNRRKAVAFKSKTLQKIVDVRSTEAKDYTLMNYIAGFIQSNFKRLIDFTEEISSLEAAMRYQPESIQEEMASLEEGLQEIQQQLEQATEEEKSPTSKFFQFFDAMKMFSQFARVELDRIVSEWTAFAESAESVLLAFGSTTDASPVKELWGHFYIFAKKFQEALEDSEQQQTETTRLKRIQEFWMREGITKSKKKNPEEIEGHKKESAFENPEVVGLMDKLISSIKQGHFVM